MCYKCMITLMCVYQTNLNKSLKLNKKLNKKSFLPAQVQAM